MSANANLHSVFEGKTKFAPLIFLWIKMDLTSNCHRYNTKYLQHWVAFAYLSMRLMKNSAGISLTTRLRTILKLFHV